MSSSNVDGKSVTNQNDKEVWTGINIKLIDDELIKANRAKFAAIVQKKDAEINLENAEYDIKHYTNMKKLSQGGIVTICKNTLDFLVDCHVPCVRIWDPLQSNEMYIYDFQNETCTLYDTQGVHPQPFVWKLKFRTMNMQILHK